MARIMLYQYIQGKGLIRQDFKVFIRRSNYKINAEKWH